MLILGIDASSTTIGFALIDGDRVERRGHYDLSDHDINARCEKARLWTVAALTTYQPALVTLERTIFASKTGLDATLAQAYVSGAIRSALGSARALWEQFTPDQGVIALCGAKPKSDPNLTKAQNRTNRKSASVRAAAAFMGLDYDTIKTVAGKVCAVRMAADVLRKRAIAIPVLTEDEADAIGLALAGMSVRVEVAA